MVTSQSWVDGWQLGPWVRTESELEWLRSQPDSVQNLMLRFPPRCVIRANRHLTCPSPGTFGLVAGYYPPTLKNPDGLLSIRQHPDSKPHYKCKPGWVDVVGYHRGLSPSVISVILNGG